MKGTKKQVNGNPNQMVTKAVHFPKGDTKTDKEKN